MIHYHGTPFSGDIDAKKIIRARHACVSFERPDDIELVAEICQSFMVDNGAFSSWKRGATYDIGGYGGFIDKWRRHPGFDWYLMPDVIDGDEHDNARMRAAWYKNAGTSIWNMGVPVWHLHEPIKVLEGFVNSFARVAIGSSGQFAEIGTSAWWSRMAEAMEAACDEDGAPRVKLHGLRMLDPTIFSHFPFASADSTNVARNIGIDERWERGPYPVRSRRVRAEILCTRIEEHASATRWVHHDAGVQRNFNLIG